MSDVVDKAAKAYRNAYPDKLKGNEELKQAFWNGYMCRIVDEEIEALKCFAEADKYPEGEIVEKFEEILHGKNE